MIKEPGMRLQNFAEDMGIDEFLPQKRCENDKAVVSVVQEWSCVLAKVNPILEK